MHYSQVVTPQAPKGRGVTFNTIERLYVVTHSQITTIWQQRIPEQEDKLFLFIIPFNSFIQKGN